MTVASESMMQELREWLENSGQTEAAEAIQSCEIRTHHVDELVELGGGDRMWSHFDAEIAAPKELYDPVDERRTEIRSEIEKALRAHAEAEGVALRSVQWVGRFGVSQRTPGQEAATEVLSSLESSHVLRAWRKALHRRSFDPDGAITAAKAMIEAVCKEVLHERQVDFGPSADLPKLCHLTLEQLSLAPGQQTEKLWRKVLGNCESIVGALSAIRNDHSDAHGPAPDQQVVSEIHADLAVSLAGSMAAFIVSVWQQQGPRGSSDPEDSI